MIEIVTRMEIKAQPEQIFNAFVKSDQIGNFWFSKSSEDWSKGKTIELSYDEFNAKMNIKIEHLRENQQIMFTWGNSSEERAVTINIAVKSDESSVVEVKEQGFQEYEDLLTNPALSEVRTFEYEEIVFNLMNGKGGWTFVLTCLKAYLESDITTLRTGLLG